MVEDLGGRGGGSKGRIGVKGHQGNQGYPHGGCSFDSINAGRNESQRNAVAGAQPPGEKGNGSLQKDQMQV